MATAIGSVFANLALETAGFDRDVDKAVRKLKSGSTRMNRTMATMERRFRGVGRSLTQAFNVRALAGGALAAGFVLLAKRAINAGDAIAKTADRIGISTDALQEFRFAAARSGVTMQQLDGAFEAFGKRLGELQSTGGGTLAEFVNKLDGDLGKMLATAKNSDQALDVFFNAMAKLEKQTDRSALAAAGFGRQAGVAMTILVRDGTKGLNAMRREARELGLVLGESLLRDAEKTSDALGKVGDIIDAQTNRAMLALAPAITSVAEGFANAAVAAGDFFESMKKVRDQSTTFITRGIGEANEQRAVLLKALKDLNETGRARAPGLAEIGIPPILNTSNIAQVEAALARLEDRVKNLRAILEGRDGPTLKLPPITVEGQGPERVSLAGGGFARLAPPDLSLQAAGVDKLTISTARLREETERLTVASQAERIVLVQVNDATERGAAIFEATRTAAERHNIEIEELNGLLATGAINQDTFNRAVEQAGEQFERAADSGEELTRTMQRFSDQTVSGLERVFQGVESLSDAFKRLGFEILRSGLNAFSSSIDFGSLFGSGSAAGGTSGIVAGDNPLADLFGTFGFPGLAHGGFLRKGEIAQVGERGIELAVGGPQGTSIIPQGFSPPDVRGAGGGGSVKVTQNFDFRGADDSVIARVQAMLGPFKEEVIHDLRARVQQGGQMAKDFGRR